MQQEGICCQEGIGCQEGARLTIFSAARATHDRNSSNLMRRRPLPLTCGDAGPVSAGIVSCHAAHAVVRAPCNPGKRALWKKMSTSVEVRLVVGWLLDWDLLLPVEAVKTMPVSRHSLNHCAEGHHFHCQHTIPLACGKHSVIFLEGVHSRATACVHFKMHEAERMPHQPHTCTRACSCTCSII